MSEYINVNDKLPNRFEGMKRFMCKVAVGSMSVNVIETPIIATWRNNGTRLHWNTSDWQEVLAWKELSESEWSTYFTNQLTGRD